MNEIDNSNENGSKYIPYQVNVLHGILVSFVGLFATGPPEWGLQL